MRLHASKEFAAGSATSATVQFTTGAAAPTVSGEAVTKVGGYQRDALGADQSATPGYAPITSNTTRSRIRPARCMARACPCPTKTSARGSATCPSVRNRGVSNRARSITIVWSRRTLLETTDGPEHAFTTQATGSAFVLPDGRAWEMVSPPNKNGAVLEAIGREKKEGCDTGRGWWWRVYLDGEYGGWV